MLNRIKRRLRLPEDANVDDLLLDIIDTNTDFLKLYLNVKELNDSRLNSIIISTVVDSFNKLGEEGKLEARYEGYSASYNPQMFAPYAQILRNISKENLKRIIPF